MKEESKTMRAKAKEIAMEYSDPSEAKEQLLGLVSQDKGLSAIALDRGCASFIWEARHEARSSMAGCGTTCPSHSVEDALEVAGEYTSGYLDRYKVGNKSLGDCVKPELLSQCGRLEEQQDGLAEEQKFLSAIAKKLKKDDTTVRSVWSHQEAEELRGRLTTTAANQSKERSRTSSNGQPRRTTSKRTDKVIAGSG